jgi:hypothetical protein
MHNKKLSRKSYQIIVLILLSVVILFFPIVSASTNIIFSAKNDNNFMSSSGKLMGLLGNGLTTKSTSINLPISNSIKSIEDYKSNPSLSIFNDKKITSIPISSNTFISKNEAIKIAKETYGWLLEVDHPSATLYGTVWVVHLFENEPFAYSVTIDARTGKVISKSMGTVL